MKKLLFTKSTDISLIIHPMFYYMILCLLTFVISNEILSYEYRWPAVLILLVLGISDYIILIGMRKSVASFSEISDITEISRNTIRSLCQRKKITVSNDIKIKHMRNKAVTAEPSKISDGKYCWECGAFDAFALGADKLIQRCFILPIHKNRIKPHH